MFTDPYLDLCRRGRRWWSLECTVSACQQILMPTEAPAGGMHTSRSRNGASHECPPAHSSGIQRRARVRLTNVSVGSSHKNRIEIEDCNNLLYAHTRFASILSVSRHVSTGSTLGSRPKWTLVDGGNGTPPIRVLLRKLHPFSVVGPVFVQFHTPDPAVVVNSGTLKYGVIRQQSTCQQRNLRHGLPSREDAKR